MKIAIIDELHEIKRSGVFYSTESLKSMLISSGVECEIIGIKRRGRLFNKLICLPFIREFLFFPIWNLFTVKNLEKMDFPVVFYQCSTSLFLIRKSKFKRVIYTRALLARRLKIYLGLKLGLHIKLALAIAYPFIKFAEKISFRNADRIIASKQRFADYLSDEFSIQKSVFRIAPQMIDLEVPDKKYAKKYDLLYIGRLSPPKNWDMVVEIAKATNFSIIAATPEYKTPANVPDNIQIMHRVPYKELGKLISQSRIFIMPSHNEEGPRVTLEAMACGLPVVASVEGSGEFVEPGVNGIVVETNNPSDYIEAIESLLASPDKLKDMEKINPVKAKGYQPEKLGPKYIKALTF